MRIPVLGVVISVLAACAPSPATSPSLPSYPNTPSYDDSIRVPQAIKDAEWQEGQHRARDAKRKSDLQAFETAIMLFAADHGDLLPSLRDGAINDQLLAGKYLYKPLVPPDAGEHYCYSYSLDRDDYVLATWLETDDRVWASGSSALDDKLPRLSRESFLGDSACPAISGWTGVSVP